MSAPEVTANEILANIDAMYAAFSDLPIGAVLTVEMLTPIHRRLLRQHQRR